MTVRIGVIGAGRIGRVHAENVTYRVSGAAVAAVADVVPAAAEALAARLKIPKASGDYRDVMGDPHIDAVLICSSTDTHAGLIIEAAAAGKHIFCEKPVDQTLERIDAALAAVEAAGVKLQIGFNRRFDANNQAVQAAIRAGQIGEPHLLRISSRDPTPPPADYVRVSGGIFLDMMIHDFDMARFLIGSPVTEVFAAGSVLVDPEIGAAGDVDTAVVTLRFASGTLGVIDNSRRAVYGYDQRVEVFGSRGMILTENQTPARTILADAGGVHTPNPQYFFLERYNDAFIAELRAFVDAVANDTPTPVSGADGRAPVVLALAAGRSLREGRPVEVAL